MESQGKTFTAGSGHGKKVFQTNDYFPVCKYNLIEIRNK
jgi:hypothetical protein